MPSVSQREDWVCSSCCYYSQNKKDLIVSGYGDNGLPMLPEEVKGGDEEFFEHGIGIGSSYFRFQLNEKLKLMRKGPLA